MADVLDYEVLLERAKKELPEVVLGHERFEVPKADIIYDGKITIIRNFDDIIKSMNREVSHVVRFLLRELGTAGHYEEGRLILKGSIDEKQIGGRIKYYIESYVLCSECGRPDTRIVKEGRTTVLVCEACGAKRPLKVKKGVLKADLKAKKILTEGKVLELTIDDMGRRGDGIAHYGHYTIYVAGALKGQRVKVQIDKVQDKLAFGHVVK